MYIIGLTGNIATGKSTVAHMLQDVGAYLIDADKLAHDLMRAGSPAYEGVVARFGATILAPSGEIDRRKLGAIVFADQGALRDLEAIVHPIVVAESLRLLEQAAPLYEVAVVEAIKLLEANMHRYCDAIWVVVCSRQQQIERLVRTRGLTEAEAALRIDAQPPMTEKVARAHVVIDNSGSLEATRIQALNAWAGIPARVIPPAVPGQHTERE